MASHKTRTTAAQRRIRMVVVTALPLLMSGVAASGCSSEPSGDGDGDETSTGSTSTDSASSGDGDNSTGDGDASSSGDGDTQSTGGSGDGDSGNSSGGTTTNGTSGDGDGGGGSVDNPLTDPSDGPPAGWAEGKCGVPAEAGTEDVSNPTTVIGDGSPESCTSEAFVAAVAKGGVITFDCGDDPHTIMLKETAKVFNDASDVIVIDGAGLITLSGMGERRILYMNTCDEAQHFTTSHCDNQDHPRLTVQNITFIDGSTADGSTESLQSSGGAVYASGGRFKAVNTRWFNNSCPAVGQDLGGGALRVFQQSDNLPVYVVNSTFGGAEGFGNTGANGGAISSISVNWNIYNSLFSYNSATGNGGNPKQEGTPGGGSGGAIYNDGIDLHLKICGSLIENNTVKAYGEAIFFVSNNKVGEIDLQQSIIRNNCGGSWEPSYPSISHHDETPVIIDSETTISDCAQ